jgi:hypothetical protein
MWLPPVSGVAHTVSSMVLWAKTFTIAAATVCSLFCAVVNESFFHNQKSIITRIYNKVKEQQNLYSQSEEEV